MTDYRSLVGDLRRLGLAPGDTVLVHASLRAVGPVPGGAATVVRALLDVLGPRGTLAAYTCTPGVSSPRLPSGEMVPFHPLRTPSRGVGVLPEVVRKWPGAARSRHPHTSFAAIGAHRDVVVDGHALDCLLGERSPLARLEELGAKILLLGVGYGVCTAFHLAEYRLPWRPTREYECVVEGEDGAVRRHRFTDLVLDDSDFAALGAAFDRHARTGGTGRAAVAVGPVGRAECRLVDMASAVRFAVGWLRGARRQAPAGTAPGRAGSLGSALCPAPDRQAGMPPRRFFSGRTGKSSAG